jgi:hypothetical protein
MEIESIMSHETCTAQLTRNVAQVASILDIVWYLVVSYAQDEFVF